MTIREGVYALAALTHWTLDYIFSMRAWDFYSMWNAYNKQAEQMKV